MEKTAVRIRRRPVWTILLGCVLLAPAAWAERPRAARPGRHAATSSAAATIISVNFQPNAPFAGRAPLSFTGVESQAAAACGVWSASNIWNNLSIAPYPALTTNPSFSNLVNSTGAATGVGISFTGTISSANGAPLDNSGSDALENEYFLISPAPGLTISTSVGYTISGLPANTPVALIAYAPNFTPPSIGGYQLTANGTVTAAFDGSNNITQIQVTSDASGAISGWWSNGTGGIGAPDMEMDFSGFQLAYPTSLSQVGTGCDSILGTVFNTNWTVSSAEIDTYNTTSVSQQANTYQVELKARMSGGSTYVFDQTYNVAFTDPTVQAAITQAKNLLTGAGALSFTGPTQLSSTQSTSSAVNTVQSGKVAGTASTGVTEYVGPATVHIGDNGICQSYSPTLTGCSSAFNLFTLQPGQMDFDALTVSPYTISQTATTTNTTLTSQVYEIDGAPAPATPAPPPLLLALMGIAACGLFVFRKRMLRGRGNPGRAS